MKTSNNIVHLVEDRERLIEIIREGFVPNHHKEDLTPNDNPADKLVVGIPMTSFSDLPLHELGFMMKEYGRYGIVLSKLWAMQCDNLSPVHYISDMNFLKSVINGVKSGNIPLDFIRYTKKFYSEWNGKPYNNYSEREWRHTLPDSAIKWFKTEVDYNRWRFRSKKRPKAGDTLRRYALTFEIKDIVGLIVPSEKDKRLFSQSLGAIDQFSSKKKILTVSELSYLESIITVGI